MKLSDFDFDLPEELIATRPVRPRPAARLLVAEGARITNRHVADLPDLLRPGDRLVLNNTRVIPAQLSGRRRRHSAQGVIEAGVDITLIAPLPEGTWRALARPLRKLQAGDVIHFSDRLQARVETRGPEDAVVRFALTGDAFDAALAEVGRMPLPPYIAGRRATDDRDLQDYQTVFARHAGAVAAPTASLHFDAPLLEALRARGIDMTEVTLHVGAGTFLPVKVDDIRDHRMHAEWGSVSAPAAAEINATRAAGGRVVPAGTTALRLIETAARDDGTLAEWTGETDIFITPGYRFRVTDALMTNFHLPKSTLMMLVAALMGPERIHKIYAHAIQERYRFFSYGDASLLIPQSDTDGR
ncbi:tRNA preQ1(34) S-adenosylmethionine ribosyltransferase-isomerase QueA [Rhodobacteraceae bacterium 2376]|uniref:S-adenosylmethionine:tRNA ribosyltransferase-isomerase n=1 Tax=Rhabdonatronobacter sediminivivens TaxID=2743469 RepID=A0A7Z0HWA3_9RHOB|nr:tRNA preQ1(34) S-adenosylmethionine ribosyltransferase-isomerase QueA [Rhabdonatronobacter sediminivivens]NYS23457.1 tRNA preQ1(34) S-adenosylmethionine ribosyltransferase-isomerase QueA [Rhabdonatronobacter sediminivivens]